MDDGLDGAFTGPIANGPLLLTWDTSLRTVVTGRYYRFKYSATNIHGEGPTSEEVAILIADVAGLPSNLVRIDMTTLIAGEIRVNWALPTN